VGIALLGGDQDFFDEIAVGSPGGRLAEVVVIAIVIALVIIPAAIPIALIQNFSGLKGVLLGESGISTDHQEHERDEPTPEEILRAHFDGPPETAIGGRTIL
jgi:hypothetical protein